MKPIAPHSIPFGWIDLDTDQDASTGEDSYRAGAGIYPSPPLGDEYYIELHTDVAKIFPAGGGSSLMTVPIEYGKMSVSIQLPIHVLEGCNGLLNYAVIIDINHLKRTDSLEAPIGTKELTSTPATHP